MGFVNKEDIPSYIQDEKIETVDELGGDVIIRNPSFTERLALSFADKEEGSKLGHMVRLLEVSVLDGGHKQLMTAAQWEAFGGRHLQTVIRLWDIAWHLADFNGEQAAKNSKAPTSD